VPFKSNAARCHRIPKRRHLVQHCLLPAVHLCRPEASDRSVPVKAGDEIVTGEHVEAIGILGNTGEPHLHVHGISARSAPD
jgi:hypothetical protein